MLQKTILILSDNHWTTLKRLFVYVYIRKCFEGSDKYENFSCDSIK